MEQKPITVDECKEAYQHLVKEAYFTEKYISDFYIDHRDKELIEVLHKMGYEGNLHARGDFYPEYGAFYYVIDVDRISMDDAKKIMDDYIEDWKINNK
ncbi:hypothetical protein [Capnocytophaga gingivalis]|uniref:hypothetical protein n=1 Tax=Capnocytophaga gingivalis TaxID=1017 RepID=UPI0028D3CA10|nr:hypothetical protein [Capnocytophaga gingivalis]